MNNQSPLIPQGSLLEQRNKGRARVKIAVFLVLAIHGVGLMALLMQGCKKDADTTGTANTSTNADMASTSGQTTNPAPTFVEPPNSPLSTNVVAAPANTAPISAPGETATPAQMPTDYVIVKGDTFSTIAKKFHVSAKALENANPSVEPTKLKIGQTIHVPAATVATTGATPNTTSADNSGTGQTYTVKSGDSLTRISGQFGVSVKALRSFNSLKTDKIVVGQKLKIPGKTTAQAAGSAQASTTSAPPATAAGQ